MKWSKSLALLVVGKKNNLAVVAAAKGGGEVRQIDTEKNSTGRRTRRLWRRKREPKRGARKTSSGEGSVHAVVSRSSESEEPAAEPVPAREDDLLMSVIQDLTGAADDSDNAGHYGLALEQYQNVRFLIAAAPVGGGLAAVDAKTAFSMGMIYEMEEKKFKKARNLYTEAINFYVHALGCLELLGNKHKDRKNHARIEKELNERLCAILLRTAIISGKESKWQQSLEESTDALEIFFVFQEEKETFHDRDLKQRIIDQIILAGATMEEYQDEACFHRAASSSFESRQSSYTISGFDLKNVLDSAHATYKAFVNNVNTCVA
jgi:hypothetical protein